MPQRDGLKGFSDDGAQWFRGGNIEYVVQNMQGALKVVEERSFQYGFKLSVKKKQKTKVFLFTNKREGADTKFII